MAITVDSTGNPIRVTGTTAVAGVILAAGKQAKIKTVYWQGPTTVGDLLTLTDGNGKEIISMNCDTANKSQMWPILVNYDGISCTDMDSGTLYIYLR